MKDIKEIELGNNPEQSIQGRVTLKDLQKDTGIGKMFKYYLYDGTGEICICAYRNDVDKYFSKIKVDGVYTISHFLAQEASQDYRSSTKHKYQICLCQNSEIKEINEKCAIPAIPHNFSSLDCVGKFGGNDVIDVLGVLVRDWGEELVRGDLIKRNITLTDKSKNTIVLTLWGVDAHNFDTPNFSVVAIRNGIISEYNGNKSINTTDDTLVFVDPKIQDARSLKTWFDEQISSME